MLRRTFLGLLSVLILGLAGSSFAFDAGPQPDLAGWWPLDEGEGTVAYDASGNGNDGEFVGDPQWVPGMIGGALAFDGDDYVNCGNGDSLQIRDAITMAFWFQIDAFQNTWEAFISKGDNAYRASRGDGGGNATHMGISGTSAGGGNGWFNGTVIVTGGEWHHYAATYDGEEGRIYIDGVLDVTSPGTGQIGSSTYDFYIGENAQATGRFYHGLLDDVRLYSRALPVEEIAIVMEGYGGDMAGNPRPADEAVDVPRDVVLAWDPMESTTTRDVYLGTVFEDVNNASRSNPLDVLVSQGQTATTYDPDGLLEFGTTYYWRIDEVNAAPDNTIFKGQVWSFTSEPFAYPVENVIATSNGLSDDVSTPERTVDGSGLNAADQHSTAAGDMWVANAPAEPLYIQYEFDRVYKLHEMLVWNYNVQFELLLGFGIKDVTIETSENGADWTALGEVQLNQATAKATYEANTTVDFGGAPVKYVRLTVNSGWGMMGQYGLSEVRFLYIPAQAREPEPADGAANVDPAATLSWRSGREAASHEVYLGTDPNALPLAATVDQASYTPGDLEFGSTYYWQIVEVNEADEIAAWAGDVWSFATQEYALIDGFETYDDDVEAGTAIFDTWLDGWVNETGSTVGYLNSPFAEQTIVRSGGQSMPLQYDNSTSPFYSETTREFETAQDWTGNGADTLVLYVRGNAPDFVEAADGSIVMSGIGTDIWGTADQFRFAYKNLSGDGSIVVRVDSLVNSNEWAKAGVMIRETLEPGSKHAFAAATPTASHGLSFQRRPVAGQDSANTDVADIEMPHWVKLTRTGNLFTMQQSEDGVTWVDVTPATPVEIQMASNVYIGLAVTSHDAAIVTAAEFSDLATTGNVSGAWQTAEIGVAQPMGNSSESMYVRIEDASGQSATVTSADTAITARPTWQEWAIPYSDLAGVNLSRVEKMTIGVGSATSPSAGGSGTVYVDDIGFGRPAAE